MIEPRWQTLVYVIAMFATLPANRLVLAAELPVRMATQAGPAIEGSLVGILGSSVRVRVNGQIQSIPFADLQTVMPTEDTDATGPTFRVTMADGSKIAADDVSLTDSGLVIDPRGQRPIRASVKLVKAIRFRPASPATDAQWLGLLEKESRGDVMVIRRPGDKLDPASGIIETIADAKVNFVLEGDAVAAPIEKLEGVIFGGGARVDDEADIRVDDIYGSTWSVAALLDSEAEQPLRMKLSSGIEHELPPNQIASMRFTSGMSMLANEKPAASTISTYIATSVDAELTQAFFGASTVDEGNLQMHGGCRVEYRVADGFEIFTGSVRRANDVVAAGEVMVLIEMDGKNVWEQSLGDAELRGFEIPVNGARRLSIEVDSRGDGDLGDSIVVLRPRLLK
ncbi:NPCBM/NEW2 domain protein [Rubripirellula tenax]|uniref:NPCBM/NEW2 domain protein n=1 Tax=Rubripirellula tenax TaxID=2528015 RepID=A0A5C6FM06_9BACT|nr:NPCBM/NEW2 domain-containing protein [Rubripirellula tenax]TWU60542.1 NPCBM/NEW2 domain protein [Rubripirellula tenax]